MTRHELIQKYRQEYPASHVLKLDLGETIAEVHVNTEELLKDLKHYFKDFLTDKDGPGFTITAHEAPAQDLGVEYTVKRPDPGKTKIKEQWLDIQGGRIVSKRLTGMIFIFGEGENLCVGPCLENSNQVINFVNNRFIELNLSKGCLLGHAAGVSLNGRGMSMAGFSGAGKSTLALHVMSRGATFVSNDRIMVEPGSTPTMFGVAKHPRINPGTALNNPDLAGIVSQEDKAEFQALPLAELWNLEHKYDALISECYGNDKFDLKAPMDAVVILNWKRDGSPLTIRVREMADRKDLLPAFMKSTGLFYLPEPGKKVVDPGVEEYVKGLEGSTLIEMSGGVDFDKAADACIHYLKTGELP